MSSGTFPATTDSPGLDWNESLHFLPAPCPDIPAPPVPSPVLWQSLPPNLHIHRYTEGGLVYLASLAGVAGLDVVALAFSWDGKKLAAVSGLPDLVLKIWDWEKVRCTDLPSSALACLPCLPSSTVADSGLLIPSHVCLA